ncbi:cytochrome c4 [Rhodoferax aquaticus]|uniref:Cytochrome c4 n=1 Tax=Rhodoferax aquaticus TaxID=2527691 RepID=A0A515EVS4_9BURK|nr:cytochrome c4 [Rhodoferax aquaticus]
MCGASSLWASQPFTVPDTMAQRAMACTACHGKEGRATNSGFFPRIAGKPQGYLYQQLLNFRDGRRYHSLMSPLLANLSDDYLQTIAAYFAAQDLPYPPPQVRVPSASVAGRAEALVRRGDASRNIPACVSCHGSALTGVQPGTPGLLGLPRDYVNAQLGAWRTGQRQALAPDCMHTIAQRLAVEDISALSEWLAAQPLPASTTAAPAGSVKPPLECGRAAP